MTDRPSSLDPDIVAAIGEAQLPVDAGHAAAVARVRARVMQRIAAESTPRHLSVPAGEGGWHRFLPGIERKVLHEREGTMSYLLKLAPGSVLPSHRHPMDEECVVLQGRLRIGELVLPAGSFHLAHEGLPHADITTEEGAIIYLRGAPPRAEDLV